MSFAIIRHQKIKGAKSFNGRISHNSRKVITSNIIKENSNKNITLKKNIYKNYEHFIEIKKEAIRNGNIKNKTKNRMVRKVLDKKTGEKDYGALTQEFVFSHSPDAMNEKDSIEYLKKANQFIQDWFEDCEVVQSEIHLDEKTPHLHVVISYFNERELKFTQKDLSKIGKTDINKIRAAFQEAVAKGYKLKMQDGSVVTNHTAKASLEAEKLRKKAEHLAAALELKDIEALEQKEISENSFKSLEAQKKTLAIKVYDLEEKIVSRPSMSDYETILDENKRLKSDKKEIIAEGNQIIKDLRDSNKLLKSKIKQLETTINTSVQEDTENFNRLIEKRAAELLEEREVAETIKQGLLEIEKEEEKKQDYSFRN